MENLKSEVNALKDEIKKLRAELERELEKHRWIPVSERLPEIEKKDGSLFDYSVNVLCINEFSRVEKCYYDFAVEKFKTGEWCDTFFATHWMPLPKAQEEEN